MFAKSAILLLGVLGVSAIDHRAIHSVLSRQISASDLPAACQSTCASVLTIYQACSNNDVTGCLKVCSNDQFNGLTGCFNCIVQQTPGITQSDYQQVSSAVDQLKSLCASAATQTVTGALAPFTAAANATGDSTGSASGIAASLSSASDAITFTSASGGTTVGAVGGGSGTAPGAAAGTTVAAATTTPAAATTTTAAGALSSASSAASSVPASAAMAQVEWSKGLLGLIGFAGVVGLMI